MKALKIVATIVAVYLVLVVLFELVVVNVQPDMDVGITLTTTDAQGKAYDRKLAGVRMDEKLYISANHWPRPWYHQARENPSVEVTEKGTRSGYTAVPVEGAELERIEQRYQLPFWIRALTAFPPRTFLRLDPR